MRRRVFRLSWHADDLPHWTAMIHQYADTAFPPGGSPCSQASRESLRDLAGRIVQGEGHVDIGASQRPMLKAALKWYLELNPDLASSTAGRRMWQSLERR